MRCEFGDDHDDADLVAALRRGSQAAAALYERHRRTVRFVIADNVHDLDDADDVAQEVFARAFSRVGSLRDDQRFRAWLLQIARRLAVDHRRHRSRRPVLDDQADLDVIGAEEPGPDLEAEVRVLSEALHDGVAGLAPRDAAVLTMVVELGLGVSEVADVLGISPANARVVLHRARGRLRAAVEVELRVEETAVVVLSA